jgi:general stress protein 26
VSDPQSESTASPSVRSFDEIRSELVEVVQSIVYATMTTVDAQGRPRARVLINVWELDGDAPVGWLATYKTPVKSAHLARNPHVTMSYWSPRQDFAAFDTTAEWVDDRDTRAEVWDMYGRGNPLGVGYDPSRFWRGPNDSKFHVLRLDPWRVQVLRGRDLATGTPSRIWRRAS